MRFGDVCVKQDSVQGAGRAWGGRRVQDNVGSLAAFGPGDGRMSTGEAQLRLEREGPLEVRLGAP